MPRPKLYFENALASISEHPDGYIIFTYRAGKRRLSDLRAALVYTEDLLYQRKWHRILGDQRLMAAPTPKERAIIATYWQKQTLHQGYGICVASVLAEGVIARLAATQLRADLRATNVNYRVFDDKASASIWLRAQTTCPLLEQGQ